MKRLETTLKKITRIIDYANQNVDFYSISINTNRPVLTENMKKYVTYHRKETTDPVEKLFNDATVWIPIYIHSGEIVARTEFLIALASTLQLTPLALNGEVLLPVHHVVKEQTLRLLEQIDTLFTQHFNEHLTIALKDISSLGIFEERLADARQYYIEKHGSWTESFLAKLGDELSRDSFISFLRQRIKAHVFKGSNICYPVLPPVQSRTWRQQREQGQYDFPSLEGCLKEMCQFFYRDTFIYEQYAIPGIVEAMPGATVIDGGTFVGDTACYFSRKVGENGKVFAFEIVPESIRAAERNMLANKCFNVEVIPRALSDKNTTFSVFINNYSNSAACIADTAIQETEVSVKSVRLDDFVNERKLNINFVKADIEGAEMQMLRGGAHTIARDAPTCAICLYHKQEDYWEIPQYLNTLCSDYTFWFRCEAEPVLFAAIR